MIQYKINNQTIIIKNNIKYTFDSNNNLISQCNEN